MPVTERRSALCLPLPGELSCALSWSVLERRSHEHVVGALAAMCCDLGWHLWSEVRVPGRVGGRSECLVLSPYGCAVVGITAVSSRTEQVAERVDVLASIAEAHLDRPVGRVACLARAGDGRDFLGPVRLCIPTELHETVGRAVADGQPVELGDLRRLLGAQAEPGYDAQCLHNLDLLARRSPDLFWVGTRVQAPFAVRADIVALAPGGVYAVTMTDRPLAPEERDALRVTVEQALPGQGILGARAHVILARTDSTGLRPEPIDGGWQMSSWHLPGFLRTRTGMRWDPDALSALNDEGARIR
jgi:hypothetical protein